MWPVEFVLFLFFCSVFFLYLTCANNLLGIPACDACYLRIKHWCEHLVCAHFWLMLTLFEHNLFFFLTPWHYWWMSTTNLRACARTYSLLTPYFPLSCNTPSTTAAIIATTHTSVCTTTLKLFPICNFHIAGWCAPISLSHCRHGRRPLGRDRTLLLVAATRANYTCLKFPFIVPPNFTTLTFWMKVIAQLTTLIPWLNSRLRWHPLQVHGGGRRWSDRQANKRAQSIAGPTRT